MNDALIVRIAGSGEGVTADGRHAVLAAPGDLLTAEGKVVAGPHHVDPPCQHFPRCGGCQIQHVDDAAYREFLAGRIIGAFHAQGLDAPTLRPSHLSPPKTRRRVSLRAELRGRHVLIGFNEAKSHQVVDMRQCEIMLPELFALVDPLRRLLPKFLKPRRAATIQMTRIDQGVDLSMSGVEVEGLDATEALTEFATTHRLARLSLDQGYGTEVRWEPEPATITFGSVTVAMPINAFLQATDDGETMLAAAVADAVGPSARVADLFAGLGTFALRLPGAALAVEGEAQAVIALKQAGARARLPLQVEARDLFRRPLVPAELARFDAVILDPPRAGAREQVVELASADISRIAYVSCNPATFARDARTLIEGGWKLDWVQPVGQFRWTTHVELASAFSR